MTAPRSKNDPTVPRRFRKTVREAEQVKQNRLDALERATIIDLDRHRPPAAPPVERVPLRERPLLTVTKPALVENPRGELVWLRQLIGNRIRYHGWSLPGYVMDVLRLAWRGACHLVRNARNYVEMPRSLEAIAKLRDGGNPDDVKELSARYEARRKARRAHLWKVAAVAAGVVLGTPLLLAVLWLVDLRWIAALAVAILALAHVAMVGWLAWYGHRHTKKTKRVVLAKPHRVARIEGRPNATMVAAAFEASGIKDIVCDTEPRRVGAGWESVVRIPVGNDTFKTAAKAHDRIAGNLGIGAECLVLAPIPTAAGGSEKHVRIWWSRTDPFRGDPPPHPLLDRRRVPADLWNDGLPIGIDPRGSEIRLAMIDTPFVGIVGRPGSGKSFAFLDVITGIAADPLWDLDCWSFKPSDDFSPAKPLVEACGGVYRCGTDEATFKAFYDYLRRRRSEYVARNEALGRLPIDRRPRMKVERDVAADPTVVPSQRPRAVLVDEILTALGNSKWGTKILNELEELARTIRSQNGVFFFGSQFSDSGVYEDLQKLLGARICLSMPRWQDSKGALGGDHDPDTADASKIPLAAKGVAIVAGAMADPVIGERPTVKGRFYGNDLRWVNDHIARCLAGPRAGQQVTSVDLSKEDPEAEAFRWKLAGLFESGEDAVTCMVLAGRHGLGETPAGSKELVRLARAAEVEPRKDSSGRVTGQREALYVHLDQLS